MRRRMFPFTSAITRIFALGVLGLLGAAAVPVVGAATFSLWQTTQGTPTATPGALNEWDKFLVHHPTVSSELSKDPSLVDNKQYVDSHPALRAFLTTHPSAREEADKNPNYFAQHERAYQQTPQGQHPNYPNGTPSQQRAARENAARAAREARHTQPVPATPPPKR